MSDIVFIGDSFNPKSVNGHCYRVEYDEETETSYTEYYSCSISGRVNISNTHHNFRINGKKVALEGDSTLESDDMHSSQSGIITRCNKNIKVNGKKIAMKNDEITLHNGEKTTL